MNEVNCNYKCTMCKVDIISQSLPITNIETTTNQAAKHFKLVPPDFNHKIILNLINYNL